MEKINIFLLILAPISMFISGFIGSRQLRSLENVPVFYLMYVKYRFLFSVVMGIIVSLFFTTISTLITKLSIQQLFIFIAMFLLATFSYYFGVTIGWGHSLPVGENNKTPNRHDSIAFPENVTVENILGSIKITISTQKRWFWFVMSLSQWLIMGLCALPIVGLMLFSVLQNYLPDNMKILVGVLIGGLLLYLLFTKFHEVLEYIFDKEVIEINSLSVRVEKYGLGLKNIKEYPADNIKMITTMFSFAGTNVGIRRSPFVNQNMPAFIMWHSHGVKRFRYFGRALNLSDAQGILEMVHSKYPQYKG